MVQIGSFHIGSSTTAEKPTVTSAEAYLYWDFINSRYDVIQLTQFLQNFIHDLEFKDMVTVGLQQTLEGQVAEVEELMTALMIPLPKRPPKSINMPAQMQVLDDSFIFRRIFTGIQTFLQAHVRTVRSLINNDPARSMFIKFLKDEIAVYDNMIKYGKLKGWLQAPPSYHA